MCGICGTATPKNPPSPQRIAAMCATMTYRGPDEDGFLTDAPIALGMRRLKIIDLDTGSQPMTNEDGSVSVMFNGEIYNYLNLRRELEALGHSFHSTSDTEVIAHAYEEYGADMLPRLNGMFAFALWDARRRRLLLGRDRAGQKPLFYYRTPDNTLVFASEIKVLLASGLVPRAVNHRAIYHYLSTQYVMGPETIFEDVHQLPPAHFALWTEHDFSTQRYWQPSYEPKADRTRAEWLDLTRYAVKAAVERHMLADVPLGAYLSGGVDSSIVVALMSQLSQTPIKTFSIGFDVPEYSETDHARRVAQRYHTEHHEFVVDVNQITESLESVVYHADQPLADTSLMATKLLAKLTREHVTVALTGDGGDEAFAGYTRYTLDRLLRGYRILPEPVRVAWVPAVAGKLPERPEIPTDRNIVAGLRRLAQASTTTHKASILAWGSFFSEDAKHELLDPSWLAGLNAKPTPDVLAAIYDRANARTRLDRTLAVDFVTYLADDLLVKADRMSMAHSLETRAPFLDNDVLALTGTMPESLKIRGRSQKWILREAFADLLPPENVNRVKRGFGMPVAAWFRGHMAGYARDVLLDPHTLERGYFQPQAVARLIDDHTNQIVDNGQRIWALLVLELWHRQFVDIP